MKYDRIFAGGTIATPEGMHRADLCVRNGRIAAWEAPEQREASGAPVVDCDGLLLLPGIVDMHFHCRTPGAAEREDFDSATAAAARGGVTLIAEMPIARPSPHDAATFAARVRHAGSLAVVDFAFYGAGATQDREKATILAEAGAVAFKIFLHQAPKGREDEFRDLCAPGSGELHRSLAANAATGLLTCVHAEDDGLIRALSARCSEDEKKTLAAQMISRPPECEELAVYTAAMASRPAGARLHICHVSSLEAARAIARLQSDGLPLTAETCPHYLLMDTEEMARHGTLAKVNPPLRGAEHREALRAALAKNIISAVASDHAPFLRKEKLTDDFTAAPGGMPNIEFFGPLMWDAVADGLWTWPDIARWTAETPARLLGIGPRKGGLYPGADADLALVDPAGTWSIPKEKLFTRSRESADPLAERSYRARLVSTWVRGRKVYEHDSIHVEKGYGAFVPGQACGKP